MAIRSSSISKRRGRENRARWGVVLIAVSLVVAALIVRGGMQPEAAPQVVRQVVAEYETVSVPVAVENVAAGTLGRDIALRFAKYPASQQADDVIRDPAEVSTLSAVAQLPAGMPLMRSNFTEERHAANAVVERIPVGMRAMTVKVDATSAVEGWAGSGSIVDVLLIEPTRTTVIAERVRILSAERRVAPVDGSSAPAVPSTVTLLVSQEQCLAINAALPVGRIAFALRNAEDEKHWGRRSYSMQKAGGLGDGSAQMAQPKISGYASYSDDKGEHKPALSEGRWIRTSGVVDGSRPTTTADGEEG